jgi:3-oxoacyl-[acyl-carrier protein] reductase
MELSEQVVLVTGASRGLGAAIARAFGAQGATVIVNYYRSEDSALTVAEAVRAAGGRAFPFRADVREREQVEAMVAAASQRYGPLTTLVNNALPTYRFDPTERRSASEMAWSDYQNLIDGVLKTAYNAVQVCLPGMMAQSFGRIINIGTNLVANPVVAYHDYTTAKAALHGFARNLATDLGLYGITVNTVAPGLLEGTDASQYTTDRLKDALRAAAPLRRITRPEDVAGAVLFFASPWAAAVTGQSLNVDGGFVMT